MGDVVRWQAGHSMKGKKKAAITALLFNCQVFKEALDSQTPDEIKKENNAKVT